MSKDGSESHRTGGDAAGHERPVAEPGPVGTRNDPGERPMAEASPVAVGSSAGETPVPDADFRGPAPNDEVPTDEDSVADPTGAKTGKGRAAVRRAAKAVADSAKKAPAVIAKDALVVAAASQPYLKAAIEKQRAGGETSAEGAGQTPAADLPAGTPGPLGVLAAGVAEALVEKAVGLVAGRDAAHKAGVAAAKAAGELADKAAAAAAEKAIRAVAGPADATQSDRASTVLAPAAAVPAAETRIAKKATKPRKKSGRGKAEAEAEPEIPSPS